MNHKSSPRTDVHLLCENVKQGKVTEGLDVVDVCVWQSSLRCVVLPCDL